MGFSTSLQSKAAHEALLSRQEAELRLLMSMRGCLVSKVKCDRKYADALAAVVSQGRKLDKSEDLAGSSVLQTWRTMLEELENTARLIKQNADTMESKTLEKLNSLYAEKRKAMKFYQEEYNRIAAQFAHLVDDVSRKKTEYQKYLDSYKQTRAKFEEQYVIKLGRGSRQLDEVRDRVQKACRKLHLTHNEYVLLLNEAAQFEMDFRTVLLPGLLEFQQAAQEAFILTWRALLQEVAQLSNFSSEQFREMQERLNASVDSIQPTQEYLDFIDRHKTRPPSPVLFPFDDTLVEDTSGKLTPNQLTVDNLTVDWLRNKLAELEQSIRVTQERQELIVQNDFMKTRKTSNDSLARLTTTDSINKEVNELRCLERKLQHQIDVINCALKDVGCEELPLGCDLSIETSFVDPQEPSVQMPAQQGDWSSLTVRKHQQRLVNILRKPFRRKSTSSPLLANCDRVGLGKEGLNNAQEEQQGSDDCFDKSLVDEEWFHGVLPREEVVRLLRREGDFLVRETTRNEESQTVLSVCWGGHKHFIVQTTPEGQYRFEGPAFSTVQELIHYQYKSNLPVTGRSGAVLRKPILRERWELNNDDVVLLDKIGRGNFGDVFKARLKNSRQDVAVKTCRMTLPDDHRKKFLQEGRILKQYDHPNIVKLIGICVQKQPVMIVMELVPGGSLLTFLRNNSKTLTQKQLLGMCRDTAAGMRYLESKNCIHRDLAARNCLVGHENIVKISDFGMSREEEEYIVSEGMKQIPIKWTAPEALNFGKYTSLCDVWSYGVLTWEIFSKGSVPYSGLSNSKARERIDEGYRMPAPEGTPDEMYRLMLSCWDYEPEKRPHFEHIYLVLDALFCAQR
ncbi:tyrosine-protein kinase Fer isoform X2 [Bacillus rossius redtenbacheri]|uniref:tyrosine-protein kinase Fer isoform X2 n=1 Tax=Bacillus rossius redtenbacheri TaxID=93214 RepID=UPI002FDD7F9C